jgi:putative membrane protein
MSDRRLRPRAFRLDDEKIAVDDAPAPFSPTAIVKSEPAFVEPPPAAPLGEGEREIEAAQAPLVRRSRFSLAGLVLSGLGGLVSLAVGLWTSELIEELFARTAALGWIGVAFLAVFGVGLILLVLREYVALLRQQRIAELHAALARARAADDGFSARKLVLRLVALYENRPETARGRAEVKEALEAIVDGRDLIDIAERSLLRPLDAKAQAEIAAAAKRVSLVTALSPRAILDLLFVIAQAARLCRRIAEIYGGRPGMLGFFRLMRSIGAHLAITGGMAVGDSLIQQVVGHGIASKISARMGEGVLNGLLTARVGISALSVCRPAPFNVAKPPGVSDVAPFLFGGGKES